MDNIDNSSNKTFGTKNYNAIDKPTLPIKKSHFLEGKYFVVFDKSIVEKLGYFNEELYFYQEIADDGCIILHPTKVGD